MDAVVQGDDASEVDFVRDQQLIENTVGTIVPDDISDLIPIILGREGDFLVLRTRKDVSSYICEGGDGGCSSDEEGPSALERDNEGGLSNDEEHGLSENQNHYMAVGDPDEDDFGVFVGFGDDVLNADHVPVESVFETETATAAADSATRILPRIPPLSAGNSAS